ncbi:uncharacterized protein LOC134652090 [Cydia amplana]|uniref:uncharacterized protein LOC134652090 n=1 Tax=Cydia amplana TaxID=1869771 RepID=UPI002FE67A71
MGTLSWIVLSACLHLAAFSDPGCVIDLSCRECIPDNMPHVSSHRAVTGAVRLSSGEQVSLVCRGSKFLTWPLQHTVLAVCEGGRYRVQIDNTLRHLLELGCQENIFEDVLHHVDHCAPPYQGRAYQSPGARGARHLAALCYDSDRAIPLAARAAATGPALPPHREQDAPRSLLGNFNQMFDTRTRTDTDQLYSDEKRLNKRVREILRHDPISLSDQELTSATLLSPHYFDDQDTRVADFPSNRIAAWRGIAHGNLRHLHKDVSEVLRHARANSSQLDVWTGTHDIMSFRADSKRVELFLKPGRFPVPKYLWTLVHDPSQNKAIAVVVLNDPFVAVSEIRSSVFCESMCARASWLKSLLRNRNYESPVYGLVFCCNVHDFSNVVTEMPKAVVANVPKGIDGLLTDYPNV